jgi:hypothetical protein
LLKIADVMCVTHCPVDYYHGSSVLYEDLRPGYVYIRMGTELLRAEPVKDIAATNASPPDQAKSSASVSIPPPQSTGETKKEEINAQHSDTDS